MSFVELKAALSLATVFICRMLGLFMVLPVLALFAQDLQGASPSLVGVAIGAYGFSQALLQIPFGRTHTMDDTRKSRCGNSFMQLHSHGSSCGISGISAVTSGLN